MPELGTPFDFREGLPASLVLEKPQKPAAYDESVLRQNHGGWPLMTTLKHNGYRILMPVVPSPKGFGVEIRLFTDGGHRRVDGNVPHIISEAMQLNIPPMTFLLGELVAVRQGIERLSAVGGILKMASAREAVARQEREGRLKLVLHGALCWNGEWLNRMPYDEVLAKLVGLAPPIRHARRSERWIRSVRLESGSIDELQRRVTDQKQEGLVLRAHNSLTTWHLGGQHVASPRPGDYYKWKPIREDDFIAEPPVMSTAKPGRIKEIPLRQIDPTTGKLFKCGHLRSLSARLDAQLRAQGFPMVLELKFNDRLPSGKILKPEFVRIRDDKHREQCIAPESYEEAQFVE